MKKIFFGVLLSAFIVFSASAAFAQTKTRVRFPAGTHGTAVKGTIRGYAYRDYVVGARGGQSMDVSLVASNSSTVVTVFAPDGNNLEGAAEADGFRGVLPGGGDYVVRVLMMRSAARRKGSVSTYTLKISIR
jgi:hypothetical protein